jgi:hypothetical protein
VFAPHFRDERVRDDEDLEISVSTRRDGKFIARSSTGKPAANKPAGAGGLEWVRGPSGRRPRSPAPNAATVREPWSAAPTSAEVLRNASASLYSPLKAEVAANGRQHMAADPIPR